ncbi:hypothetical protein BH11VER1_BH11VER1_19730 [soil metagenome]
MNILRLTAPFKFERREANSWRDSCLKSIASDHHSAEVDLTKTQSIDAAGVAALVTLNQAFVSFGNRVCLVNPTASIVQLLELMGMHRVFQFATKPTASSSMTKGTILVVEDERIIRSVVEMSLRPLGHPLVMAENGMEAINIAHRENPALIILDYVMPVMDGEQTLRRLKMDEATKHIPVIVMSSNEGITHWCGFSNIPPCPNVIVMSANERIAHGSKAQFAGASLFISKPFNPTTFRSEVLRIMTESLQPCIA